MNYVPWEWKIIVNFNCMKMISFRPDLNSTNTNRPPQNKTNKKKSHEDYIQFKNDCKKRKSTE